MVRRLDIEAGNERNIEMNADSRRITLIARHPGMPERAWDDSTCGRSRLIFVDSLSFLPFALDRGINELGQDVDRVIIDRTGTAVQFLELLASLPHEFVGDVLFVRGDGAGFLSSQGRGGDRVLYALSVSDVDFYLMTHGLLYSAAVLALPSPMRVARA